MPTQEQYRAAKRRKYYAAKFRNMAEDFASVPDCNRGDERLAAEVTLACLGGQFVDDEAQTRAARVLCLLAGRVA